MLKWNIDELWEFVRQVYRRDLSQEVISILAAGPLEDILAMKGEEYIDQIELLAKNDPKFSYILGGVWKNAMANEVWSRVQAVAQQWK